jgi:hypothetical protein
VAPVPLANADTEVSAEIASTSASVILLNIVILLVKPELASPTRSR